MNGIQLIAAERQRQIEDEGWSPQHDGKHTHGELIDAAREYAAAAVCLVNKIKDDYFYEPSADWPWSAEWWKPSEDPIRNLVKAGALIAAEIDRLQRLKS